jgi:hypothetical protein
MNEILHANIFFIITSIATVIFSIIASLILWQVFKLVKSLRMIVERVEVASEQIAHDAANLRGFVTQGGIFSKMIGIIMGAVASGRGRQDRD